EYDETQEQCRTRVAADQGRPGEERNQCHRRYRCTWALHVAEESLREGMEILGPGDPRMVCVPCNFRCRMAKLDTQYAHGEWRKERAGLLVGSPEPRSQARRKQKHPA